MLTNVPGGIIAYLQIKHFDKIEWRMERIGEQRVVIVSKIQPALSKATTK